MGLTDAALALAESQEGVVTRGQLARCGVTRETIRWRVGRDWRLLLPGVLMLNTGLPTERQRLVAALLLGGEGSWLGGRSAAALHGLESCPMSVPLDVIVPAPRRPRRIAWVSIRSTTLVNERIVERGPLRWSSAARAVVDAAAGADGRQARAILIEAVQRRLVRLDDLEHWVDARASAGSVRLRAALAEAAAGAWSVPEADLLALVRSSPRLPEPLVNPLLELADHRALTSPDLWFDDVGLAVMVQSKRYHAASLDWDATVESGSDLALAGITVIGVTPTALAADPRRQLVRIEQAHREVARVDRRPAVTARPRPALPGMPSAAS